MIDSTKLTACDAVAALIVLDNGHYLLQHRDNVPDIWYPGHWGCFGGAVDEGEDPLSALHRELYEEIEFKPQKVAYFTRFDFDLTEIGMRRFYRIFYVIPMTADDRTRIILHEGQAVDAFSGETIISKLKVTPYDAFALFLHIAQGRLGIPPTNV